MDLASVGRRLAKESVQYFTQALFLKAITIFASILLARLLGPAALGRWALVTATSGWLWLVAELGIGTALVSLAAEDRSSRGIQSQVEGTGLRIGMLSAGLMAAIYALLAPVFAVQVYGAPEALPLFVLSAATFLPTAMTNVLSAILQAHRRVTLLSTGAVVAGTFHACTLVLGAYLAGLTGAFAAALVSGSVSVGIYAYLVRKTSLDGDRFLTAFKWSDARRLVRLGLGSSIFTFVGLIGSWFTLTLFASTASVEEVGHYSVAWRVASFVVLPASAVFGAFFPLASETYKSNLLLFGRSFRETVKYALLAMVPATASVVLLAPEIVGILYGPAYMPAANLLALLASAGFLQAFTQWGSMMFVLSRAMHRAIAMVTGVVGCQVVVGIIAIPSLGANGLVLATTVATFCNVALAPAFLRDKLPARTLGILSAWGVAIATGFLAVGWFARSLDLPGRVSVLSFLAAATAILLRSFLLTAADLSFLRSVVRGALRRLSLYARLR